MTKSLISSSLCSSQILPSSLVVYMSSRILQLAVGSHDLSQAEKKLLLAKLRKFTKRQPRTYLSENKCHFMNLFSFARNNFFSHTPFSKIPSFSEFFYHQIWNNLNLISILYYYFIFRGMFINIYKCVC